MDSGHIWRAAQERLKREMTHAQFETWLRGTSLRVSEDGSAALGVRTTFARELLESRYRTRIESAIAAVTGHPCTLEIAVAIGTSAFAVHPRLAHSTLPRASRTHTLAHGGHQAADVVRPRLFAMAEERAAGGSSPEHHSGPADMTARLPVSGIAGVRTMSMAGHDHAHVQPGQAHDGMPQRDGGMTDRPLPDPDRDFESAGSGVAGLPTLAPPRLNPRYTFATFIVGSGNQLAHAASVAVAEAPGSAYNPLFLYGDVGLGKTHLLHAIGHSTIERDRRVLYVSSETFTNEIINAIRFRTTEEFRAKYRSVDMLLVDDIQFIAGKDSTEEEFFHTFNSLYETSKQIVICSDRPPKAIISLEERLRSRFQWGLIADIQPPDLETRVAILRAKADLLQRSVPDEVLQYLAAEVHSNIRELEGSLNRLLAISQLQGKPLSIETARAALATVALDGKHRHVGTGEVISAVAEFYHIPIAELQGKQRDKRIVVPRQVAMYLMRQETDASLLEIGQMLGGRDHSTVLHGCEKIGREINENTALRKEVLAIRQHLLG